MNREDARHFIDKNGGDSMVRDAIDFIMITKRPDHGQLYSFALKHNLITTRTKMVTGGVSGVSYPSMSIYRTGGKQLFYFTVSKLNIPIIMEELK